MATPTRADRYNPKSIQPEYYSDLTVNFDKNPLTGFLARVTNEDSIIQSLQALVLTIRSERPFQPWIGSKTNASLFEPNDVTTNFTLQKEIETTIKNCEPRVSLIQVLVQNMTNGQQPDDNSIFVSIFFSINNIPGQTFSVDVILRRDR